MTKVQKFAWVFAVLFLLVFVVTNISAFNDAEGRNFGLFKIDPIDNIVHLLTAILGAIVAWRSLRWSVAFFWLFGILYGLDALVGLSQQRGLLDFSIFIQGLGTPDFGLTNLLINLPHILIAAVMIAIGFVWSRKLAAN